MRTFRNKDSKIL